MYAIVEIAGKQYKLEKDATVNVDRMNEEAGKELVLDRVLLFADGATVQVGKPYVDSVKVRAEVLGEVKGKKVRGIKFKKRKNYTRTLGHRTIYSQLKVKDLVLA
jgi:large subunit ribosomal protein L21